MENKELKSKLLEIIEESIGTEHYYQYHTLQCTDGVMQLVEVGEMYWLLDIINSYQIDLRNNNFQVWELKLQTETPKHFKGSVEQFGEIIDTSQYEACLLVTDGNEQELLRQYIMITDCSIELSMWCVNRITLLPSEC
jgi:hypothetical protein